MSRPWGAEGVGVTFAKTRALDDITMQAAPGMVTAVVGGDGAGKTTLLRCLAGALAPDRGVVTGPGPRATGYFPASSGTYPDLTVTENLAFRATAYNLHGSAAAERTAELLEHAGLAEVRDRLAGQLSGGMRQKLGVIAAMLHRPDLLVLDEPSTGVDPVSRSGLWLLIATAAASGAAVVLSTTYLDDAQRAGFVLVLDNGRELASGTAGEIVARMPGSVRQVAAAPAGPTARLAWRRGGGWRVWTPPASATTVLQPTLPHPATGEPVTPDLQDAVTVAALARELQQVALSEPEEQSVAQHRESGDNQPRGSRASEREHSTGERTRLAASAPLADCESVTCRFGQFTAVREVSVQIRPGEVVGLLGANGAGKTTLIRMLLGLQRPTSGQVVLLGGPPSRDTRSRIGYVPQGLGLYDDLTATENMQFAAAVFRSAQSGLPADIARRQRVPVGRLPLGLQRRTAFAQALAHRPDLLVLDEPTSGVDPLGRARLWDTIARAARGGAGVLVSTHYMEEAGECDRLIVMAGGVVVAAGTAGQIIGNAQVTVVEATAWASAFRKLAEAGVPAALAGQALRVPGASIAQVQAVLGPGVGRLSRGPATLEERFFELAQIAAPQPVSA